MDDTPGILPGSDRLIPDFNLLNTSHYSEGEMGLSGKQTEKQTLIHTHPYRPKVRGYRPEVRGYRPEVRGYRPEVRGYRPEVRGYINVFSALKTFF